MPFAHSSGSGARGEQWRKVNVRMKRWTTLWLAAMVIGAGLLTAAPATAQYYSGDLPEGVLAVTVDGQPINANASPETDNPSPVIDGLLEPGPTEAELAIGNGEIVRFTVEVDGTTGAFTGSPPDPLTPGTYSLYIDDELIGEFTVTGPTVLPDLALMVTLPDDLGDADYGVVDGMLLSVTEEARRSAANAGDDSPEAVAQLEQTLRGSGWSRRYENRIALPKTDDPTQFQVLVGSFVIEFESADQATATFAQITQDGDAVEGAASVGDESIITRTEGTTSDTGAPFISLALTFRVEQMLVNIAMSDLAGGEPDQAVLEAAGAAVQGRIQEQLSAADAGLSSRVLRIGLTDDVTYETHDEGYERLDGTLVPRYNEPQDQADVRDARFADATDAYTALVEGTAADQFRHVVALYSFEDDAAAAAWLGGVEERLRSDPLSGYLSMSLVDGGSQFGDGSSTYSFRHRAGGATTSGFRYYVQVGSTVAQIELSTEGEASQEQVEQLVQQQVDCLGEISCGGTATFPGGGGGAAPADTSTGDQTPAADSPIVVETPAAEETPAG